MIAVTLIALGIVLYTYAGYPVVIAILAKLAGRPHRRDPEHLPTVTALIPVYNGERYVEAKVRSVLEQDYPPDRLDVLLYSDGSDDGTDEIGQRLAAETDRVRFVRADKRGGKPAGLNTMLTEPGGELLLMTDIRQPLTPNTVRDLASYFADPEVGCVSGNLQLQGATGAGFYWRYENWIRRSESAFRSMVGVTGPIYAVRREDVEPLPTDTILDDMWIPMRLRLRRRRLLLCESAIALDDAFEDGREWGRKTRTLAGNYQLFARMPALLVPFVNPSWFETISHKVFRLVCPWALLATLVGSAVVAVAPPDGAPEWLRWAFAALLAGQVLAYLGAAVGAAGGRITRLARTFVVMNAAAVVGLWRHVRNAQRITW